MLKFIPKKNKGALESTSHLCSVALCYYKGSDNIRHDQINDRLFYKYN